MARMLLPWAATSTRRPERTAAASVSCQNGRKRATVSLSDSASGNSSGLRSA